MKASGAFLQALGETETPLLEGAHKVFCAPEPEGKAVTHRTQGKAYLLVLEVPWGGKGQPQFTVGKRVVDASECTHWHESSWRPPF